MSHQTTMFDTAPEPVQYDNAPLAPPPAPPESAKRASEGEARARSSDPASSHEAAERMNRGAANVQRQRVIDMVWKWPGRTSKELAKLDGDMDRHAVARRLPEAEAMGEVHRRSIGTTELTWWPGEKT